MNLSFLFPTFLFAMFAISIPVIIHLFNFRKYKIVYFSNLKFLQNIQNLTKSTSQLKNLLILICRILVIIFLVFAFSQPYIPDSKDIKLQNQKVVSVYIDNSFSMDGESKYGKMIEVAKKKVKEIADAYTSDTKFLLLSNDLNPKYQTPVNKKQLIEYLGEISICPEIKNISEIISLQQDLIHNEIDIKKKNLLYILSDFQKSTFDLKNIKNDTNTIYRFLPLNTQTTNNLYIDSCWFETPVRKLNQQENLFVKVVNISNESYKDIPIKLYINDTIKSLASFNINENESRVVKLSYKNMYTGIIKGKVEIIDYPITYDNTFYFSYKVLNKIKLMVINEEKSNKYIDALFSEDEYIELQNCKDKGLDYSVLSNYNILILNELHQISSGLNQELINYASSGGTVIVIPEIDCEINSYNNLLQSFKINGITGLDTHKTKISKINYDCNILKNVFRKKETNIDYPIIYNHYIFSNLTHENNEIILSSEKNDNILSCISFKYGKIYLLAIPLNDKYTNFTKHPLFVPVMYNIVSNSVQGEKIYNIIGIDEYIELKNIEHDRDNIYHIINQSNNFDFIPEQKIEFANIKLFLHHSIKHADNYIVTYKNQVLKGISFNYNRKESDLKFYSKKEISEILKNNNIFNFSFLDVNDKYLTKSIKEINEGIRLWKYCILLSLLFLGIEILLIRVW